MEWWGVVVLLVGVSVVAIWLASLAGDREKPQIIPEPTECRPKSLSAEAQYELLYEAALARETELAEFFAERARETGGKLFYSKVVGVTFRNRSGPSRQKLIDELRRKDELWLEREPRNRKDKNAVAVLNLSGERIGYISTSIAAQMGPSIDSGDNWLCFVAAVTGTGEVSGVNIALITWKPDDAKA